MSANEGSPPSGAVATMPCTSQAVNAPTLTDGENAPRPPAQIAVDTVVAQDEMVAAIKESISGEHAPRPPARIAAETVVAHDGMDIAIKESINGENAPRPPAQIAAETAATYNEMDAAIKESIIDDRRDGDPPLPPGEIAISYGEMEETIKNSVQDTSSDADAPLPPTHTEVDAGNGDGAENEIGDEGGGKKRAPALAVDDAEPPATLTSDEGPPAATRPPPDPMPATSRTTTEVGRGTPGVSRNPAPAATRPQNPAPVVIRPPPPSMLHRDTSSRSPPPPMFHEVEARLVPDIPIYDAVQVQPPVVDDAPPQDNEQPIPTWYQRHQKSLIFGMVLIFSVALAVTSTLLASQRNNGTENDLSGSGIRGSTEVPSTSPRSPISSEDPLASDSLNDVGKPPPPESSESGSEVQAAPVPVNSTLTPLYYPNSTGIRCATDQMQTKVIFGPCEDQLPPPALPFIELESFFSEQSFETVEECCREEFWCDFMLNECLINSLGTAANIPMEGAEIGGRLPWDPEPSYPEAGPEEGDEGGIPLESSESQSEVPPYYPEESLCHLLTPRLLWNTTIASTPRDGNVIQISPDDRWLYVTSSDGSLYKLNPVDGEQLAAYTPETRGEGWSMMGYSGVSFHMDGDGDEGDEGDGGSYLVYWVSDVPPIGAGPWPSSRVVAVRHDDSTEIAVLWTKVIEGTIAGSPLIGSEGKFIYFTMNSHKKEYWWAEETQDGGRVCVKNSNYPYVKNGIILGLLHDTMEECCQKNTEAICDNSQLGNGQKRAGTKIVTNVGTGLEQGTHEHRQGPPESATVLDYPSGTDDTIPDWPASVPFPEYPAGNFVILSHPLDGEIIYQFDARSVLSIQQHYFAAAEIAHTPRRGNYDGGDGNTNDVLMWGSLPGDFGDYDGHTLLFQLPKGFDASQEPVDTSSFQVLVLESVAWTTLTKPALSNSGLDVYFAISANRLTGWNNGQKFDAVANFGPFPTSSPLLTGCWEIGASYPKCNYASEPIVLADDGKMLLLTPSDDIFTAVDRTGAVLWVLGNIGNSPFTTPKVSPDGSIAYFGKQSSVYAINLIDGSPRWGDNGYLLSGSTKNVMTADISLSSTGEILYCYGPGNTISAIRIADPTVISF